MIISKSEFIKNTIIVLNLQKKDDKLEIKLTEDNQYIFDKMYIDFCSKETAKDTLLDELTSFDSLTKRYSKVLPNYEFKNNPSSHCNIISFDHEGVPYGFQHTTNLWMEDDLELKLNERLVHSLIHFKLTVDRHHDIVKKVYKLCDSLYDEDIWCLVGGGMQLQIFFGNSTGYVGTLYLSLEDGSLREGCEEENGFKFIVNAKENDKYFADKFEIDGIEFRSHEDIYGSN